MASEILSVKGCDHSYTAQRSLWLPSGGGTGEAEWKQSTRRGVGAWTTVTERSRWIQDEFWRHNVRVCVCVMEREGSGRTAWMLALWIKIRKLENKFG